MLAANRFSIVSLPPGSSAEDWAAAVAAAEGEFVILRDAEDELAPGALEQVEAALSAIPEADFLYSDEEVRSGWRRRRILKPDFSPERLRAQPYTGRLAAMRRSLVEQVGGLNPALGSAAEWDLALKLGEQAREVVHLPQALYRRRRPPGVDPEAGSRAVRAHCERTGLPATVEWNNGVHHLLPSLERQPPVSIVIPTAGRWRRVRGEATALIAHCLRSIISTSTYEAYEIVCVYDEDADSALLSELTEVAGERLRLVCHKGPFNFSAKINLGAVESDGEQLLLLNDDVEVITPDWIERLLMYSTSPGIGAVGARLLSEDGRLQHAGVGFEGGLPGHPYHGFSGNFRGYEDSVLVARDCLAVTAACLMTPRRAFESAGGLTTELPVNYNDVDYCLKLRSEGLRVVYDPDTVLFHFESSSRSGEVERWEAERLLARWAPSAAIDPFSNPSLRGGVPRRQRPAWLR